jgi:hypothetical protein
MVQDRLKKNKHNRERYKKDPIYREKSRMVSRKWYYENKDNPEFKQKQREKSESYREKAKPQIRWGNLRARYGLTVEQYNEMLQSQNGVCAICGGINPEGRNLCVDHNHITGKFRGLLCTTCNVALGGFKADSGDGIDILLSAISYLKNNDVCEESNGE